MRILGVAAALVASLAAPPMAGAAGPGDPFPSTPKDSVAKELERLCLPLGLDFDAKNADAGHPVRKEKAASRDGGWPGKLDDSGSRVCAGASYAYETHGDAMEIRFEGSVEEPDGGVVLPLSFEIGGPRRSPTPLPTPAPRLLTPSEVGRSLSSR